MLPVEIEDRTSWPPDFLSAAQQDRELIISYQRERSRIDRLAQNDVLLRIHPPTNKYQSAYRALVERLEAELTRHRLVAYHCTRLTAGEIGGIKSHGMRLLTPELVRNRLDQCRADGHLRKDECEYLQRSEIIQQSLSNKHGNRTGMIWFCPNRSTLQVSSGVHRLFRSWGGEAVYCGHEEDPNIVRALRSIGTPCIVKCAMPFPQARQFHGNFTERFFSQFISQDIEYPEPTAGFDLYTNHDLPASGVLEVIEFFNSRFEALTNCSSWPRHHCIHRSD